MSNNPYQTIGAKQFRENLEDIFDKVNSGQSIIVSHRFKKPIKLEPLEREFSDQKQLLGLRAFDASAKKVLKFNKSTPLKQLYSDSISEKYAR